MSKELQLGRVVFGPATETGRGSTTWRQKIDVMSPPPAVTVTENIRACLRGCLSAKELDDFGISDDRDISLCVTRALCCLKDIIEERNTRIAQLEAAMNPQDILEAIHGQF